LPTRRTYLNEYLQHMLVLANAGPDSIAVARSYLQTAYAPAANAAWEWPSAYGWTSVPYDQMENYVSAQTYALRSYSASTAQAQDRWGFAWQPSNSTGLSSTDFANQTGAIVDRLAAAIHDSAQPIDPGDPGVGACGPFGQNLWCNGQIGGAWFNDGWKTFQVWALPPTLSSFTPAGGPVGTSITITGSHLDGATAVTFNGTSATFTVDSDNQITAAVPSGAGTGPIAVTTPAGTAASSTSFTITLAPPTISSFSPSNGRAGRLVTILGSGFTGATAVAFNNTSAATYAVSSDSRLIATVPRGATTGPISVTTAAGQATSSGRFNIRR
jgi:hypothetical protein